MKLLACDAEIDDMDAVLNDLNLSCGALRRVRENLTVEDGHGITPQTMEQALLLASVIRHMENLIDQGFKYEFARRGIAVSRV